MKRNLANRNEVHERMKRLVTNVIKRVYVFPVKYKDGARATVEIEAESVEAAKLKIPEGWEIAGDPHEK